jgi:Predicted membrane protein (DUF2339)
MQATASAAHLAAAVVALVLLRVAYEPRIVGNDVGTTPFFNWLFYGYGVPAAAFWYAGYLLRRRADDAPARMADSAAILFTVLLAVLQIRHYMNNGDVFRESTALAEVAMQVSVGLAMTIGLERLRLRTDSVIHNGAALLIFALTVVAIVFGLMLALNPLLTGRPVGGAFFKPDPARLWHPRAAGSDPRGARAHQQAACISRRRGDGGGRFVADVSRSRNSHALSRRGPDPRRNDRCRAVHVLRDMAHLWGAVIDGGFHAPIAAGAARLRCSHSADYRQGIPRRHGRPDGHFPRAFLHRARRRAGRYRLALPTHCSLRPGTV